MTNRFLGTSGVNTNLSNGSADLYINSLAIADITPSLPVRTNATRGLIAQRLNISDTNSLQAALDSKLANPLAADLDYQGFSATNINKTTYNKIAVPAAPAAGKVSLFIGSDGKMRKIDEGGVVSIIDGSNPFDQSLNIADSVQFANITLPNLGVYKGLSALLLKTDTFKTLETISGGATQLFDSAGNINPSLELSTLASLMYSPDHLTRIGLENSQLTYLRAGVNRVIIDAFTTTIRSQDTTVAIVLDDDSLDMNAGAVSRVGFAEAGDTHLKSADGLNVLSIDNTDFNYTVSGQSRIIADSLISQITSPDQQSYVFADDDSVEIGVDNQNLVRVTTTGVILTGYNGQMDLSITDSANGLVVQDQTGARFEIKTAHSRLYPLDEAKGFLELVDNSYRFAQDVGAGVIDRFRLNGSDTRLISPDGLSAVISENNGARIPVGAIDRLDIAPAGSSLRSPGNANSRFFITDIQASLAVNGQGMVRANADNTGLILQAYTPSNTTISVDNSGVFANAFGNLRVAADAASTRLITPDTNASLVVANSLLGWKIGANTYLDVNNVGTVNIGNQAGSTHYTMPNARGTVDQILKTDGAGVVSWSTNAAWSAQYGGNVNTAVLRYLVVSGTFATASATVLDYSGEAISTRACTLRDFSWSSASADATTVMMIYINGVVSGTTIPLTGAQGAVTTNIAIGAGQRVAVAWDPAGGGTRPDQITVHLMFY